MSSLPPPEPLPTPSPEPASVTEAVPPPDIPETYFQIARQVAPPFLIAGLGMVGAGLYLDMVQSWDAFQKSEIVVLVPALLGLKGNLEMTLASRLSTEANLGHMDDPREQWLMILGNLTLVQCQAIIVGFLSAMFAVGMVGIYHRKFDLTQTLLICSCGVITSSIASFILGLITATVIVISHHLKVNPDYVATPIAASLGDITSLALLSWVATMLYNAADTFYYVPPIIVICYILVIPFWVWIAKQNKYTKSVLYTGWVPVISAMLISTGAGMILDVLMAKFKAIAVFQPVINGVGGNLVSVLSSRLSTSLHKETELGRLPPGVKRCIRPWDAFFSKQPDAKTARVLLFMVVPGHLIFACTISYIRTKQPFLSPVFLVSYLTAAVIQVALLLYMAYVVTYFFWNRSTDPDNATIPYLTALGDFLGTSLLGITFEFLFLVGDNINDVIKP